MAWVTDMTFTAPTARLADYFGAIVSRASGAASAPHPMPPHEKFLADYVRGVAAVPLDGPAEGDAGTEDETSVCTVVRPPHVGRSHLRR